MSNNKFADKLKDGVSFHEIEGFAGKHTSEIFSVLAILIGAFSSAYDFFTGPKLTILFLAIGAIGGVLFSLPVERGLRQFYHFAYKKEKMTEILVGSLKIAIALFVPFLYFGLMGLLAGTSYHYHLRGAQVASHNEPRSPYKHKDDGEEHD